MRLPRLDGEDGLAEERDALTLAHRMRMLLDRSDHTTLRSELHRMLAQLFGALEAHFVEEEATVFPLLAARGLELEAAQAALQHVEIRGLRERLAQCDAADERAVRALVEELATALAQHVQYEADWLYVDVSRAELDAFRAELDAYLRAYPASAA